MCTLIDKLLGKNPLLDLFLSKGENAGLVEKFYLNPTVENRKKLDNTFQNFYFKVRIVSYFSKVIHFEAKNFDAKLRKQKERFILFLDNPFKDEQGGSTTIIETIQDSSIDIEDIHSENLEDYIENLDISLAIKNLTDKQKNILFLSYIKGLKDVEIAKKLNISQQSVSKSRNNALKKIRGRFKNDR